MPEYSAEDLIHLLYDLLVESGSESKQYDFEARKNLAIEAVPKFFTRKSK